MNWLKFIKLARKRKIGFEVKDYSHYSRFQEFQALEILKEIESQEIPIHNYRVLELAAGVGGYSATLYRSSKQFVSSDIYHFPNYTQHPFIDYVIFDASKKYPFDDNSFDFIFCSSLIEHVENPGDMMQEIKRVLKGDGYLYMSFPPFYSLYGGHHLSPFHYLGEKMALKLSKKIYGNVLEEATQYSNLWGEGRGLFVRTVKSVKKILGDYDFAVNLVWPRFLMKFNIAKIPLLNEVLCWHVCFICRNKK